MRKVLMKTRVVEEIRTEGRVANKIHIKKSKIQGAWVAQLIKCLPSAQVMIPGSWDGALLWASCSGQPASPFPFAPPPAVPSQDLFQINKILFLKKVINT